MDNAYQHSTIAQIIENILEQYTFEGESKSNIADILLSILNKTEYNEDPHSVIGDLLIRLKAKIEGESYDPYDAAYTSRIAEILISILEETEYTEEPQSRIAELLLQLKEELEAYVELTASGSIASFITNVVKPLVNGEFTIQAYQEGSGDPSPVNVRNIVPFNALNIYKRGVNLWNEQWELGGYNNTTGEKTWSNERIRNKDFIYLPSRTFYFKTPARSTVVLAYDKNKQRLGTVVSVNGSRVITLPSGTQYMNFYTIATTYDNDISVNYPSTDTDYHAYNGAQYTKQLGETVYGGSYNSVTGKKRKTFGKIAFDGSSDEGWNNYNNGFYIYISDMKIGNDGSNSMANWLKCGVSSTRTGINFGATNNIAYFFHITDSELFPTVTDRDTWRAYLSEHPLELTYELAEPIETDIGATEIKTLNGSNNIFCDTGDTSVTYLYKGTPPETLTRVLSKSPDVEDIIKEEKLEDLKDLDELQDLDISDKEVK